MELRLRGLMSPPSDVHAASLVFVIPGELEVARVKIPADRFSIPSFTVFPFSCVIIATYAEGLGDRLRGSVGSAFFLNFFAVVFFASSPPCVRLPCKLRRTKGRVFFLGHIFQKLPQATREHCPICMVAIFHTDDLASFSISRRSCMSFL